jgi:ABC-type methionine transport system ATPase subunit
MKAIGISQEIQLLEQIKDIQDELHTLGVLIGHQKAVVDQLCRFDLSSKNSGLSTKTNTSSKPDPSTRPNSSLKAKETVKYYDTQVKDMSKHAKLTYQAVCL